MTAEVQATGYAPRVDRDHYVTLPASPEPLRVKVNETALVVVDMQNAYATVGGYVDVAGFSVEGARGAIVQTKSAVEAARAAGIPVIYFQNGWDPRLCRGRDAGLAKLAQVERAKDHARASGASRYAAG